MGSKRQEMNNLFSLLVLICLFVACSAGISSRRSLFGIQRQASDALSRQDAFHAFQILRGGSTVEEGDEAEEDQDEEEDEDDDEPASILSTEPAKLLIQTNWGNQVLDQKLELLAARTRNVASLKKSLSRQLPGKPPILGLEIVYEGRVLEDEMLVDELFDEDDEEDEEEDDDGETDGPAKTLILNVVPPVDPKFAAELGPMLKAHVEDDEDTLSTEELIEAFYLNQVAMARNAQLLSNPNAPSSPSLRLEMQEEARQLLENLKSEVPDDVWQSSMEPVRKSHNMEERRGQRYRSGKGGARTNLKKSLQHNMNIHWGETIRNCFLFLFFGYFGGRNSVSRCLMLLGAPMCFILQARPVKMYCKILFYMLINPPGIISSLLPAPQQAILNFDMEESYAELYSTEAEKAAAAKADKPAPTPVEAPVDSDDENEVESDADSDDGDEYDEEEYDDEDDESEDEE